MSEIKINKKEKFNAIDAILTAAEEAGLSLEQFEGMDYTMLHAFIANENALLDRKAEAARKVNERKKQEGDELREAVYNALTNEYQLIDEITAKIGISGVSRNMVTARLSQLVAVDKAESELIEVPAAIEGGKSRKNSAYRLVQNDED